MIQPLIAKIKRIAQKKHGQNKTKFTTKNIGTNTNL